MEPRNGAARHFKRRIRNRGQGHEIIAGCLLAAQIHSIGVDIGEGWELSAVAAVAVGGVSLAGGAGSVLGAAIGVVFISVLNNSLILLKIDPNIQTVLIGVVMLVAVAADVIKRNRKVKG